jgi:hypothetical protein
VHGEKLSPVLLSLPRIPTRKTWEGTRIYAMKILQLTFRAIVRVNYDPYCSTIWQIAGSIPDGIIGVLH